MIGQSEKFGLYTFPSIIITHIFFLFNMNGIFKIAAGNKLEPEDQFRLFNK